MVHLKGAGTETTFPVADVEPARFPARETTHRDAIERLLIVGHLTKGKKHHPLEACGCRRPRLVAGIDYHPVVAALHLAYAQHRPISFSPDMIWLLICQGVAHHIDANAERLRSKLVRHPGRLTLEVEFGAAHRFRRRSPDSPWPEVFSGLARQIAEHVGPNRDIFIPSFSTTGPAERAAMELALLDSTRRYFHYMVTTAVCGIPAITLEGSTADWQLLVEQAEGLPAFLFEGWLERLLPSLRQFARATAGDVDVPFWQSIYRIGQPRERRAPDSAEGWIGLFFPRPPGLAAVGGSDPELFAGRGPVDETSPQSGTVNADEPSSEASLPSLGDRLPSGIASFPFRWVQRNENGRIHREQRMEFLAGFVGVAQDTATLRLRPEISWVVRDDEREAMESPHS